MACYGFCDFGDTFVVSDKNGEEPVDFYISHISQVREGERESIHDVYMYRVILGLYPVYLMKDMDWKMVTLL